MKDWMFLWWPDNSTAWLSFASSTVFTRHFPLDSYHFSLYKILLIENFLIPQKTVKGIWDGSLLKKLKKKKKKKVWNMKLLEKRQKIVEQNGEYIVLMKFSVKMKTVFFIFT